MTPREGFAAELRRLLLGHERTTGRPLKKATLAKQLSVSVSSVYAYLSGTTLPGSQTLDRILELLGVPGSDRRALATLRDELEIAVHVGPPEVPCELPPSVKNFTGRSGELAVLNRLEPVTVVSGTAGAGKTALVVQWARSVRAKFPDGALFVDLRGFDPEEPLRAAEALQLVLRQLEGPGARLPTDYGEQLAKYRSLTAEGQMLVVLDNVAGVEQVADLLPAGDASCAVITSRCSLAGLVVRFGAVRLQVGALPLDDAVALLEELVGNRATVDPTAATAVVNRCARLPLGVRIAAELAGERPQLPLAELAAELDQHVLDSLSAGDDVRTAIKSVLSWSLRNLSEEARRAFVLGGLAPSPEFCFTAVSAMTGAHDAVAVVTDLVRANLWEEIVVHRFGMNELLAAYAVELAATLPAQDRDRATVKLLRHYLDGATEAMDILRPAERHRRPRLSGSSGPGFAGPTHAKSWLDTENQNLLKSIEIAATGGWPVLARDLTVTIVTHLEQAGQRDQVREAAAYGLEACRSLGDRRGEAFMLGCLGVSSYRRGRYDEAGHKQEQALSIYRQIGDSAGASETLGRLGLIHEKCGRYVPAADSVGASLAISKKLGDSHGCAHALNNLGRINAHTCGSALVIRSYREALTEFAELGDRQGQSSALANLGQALHRFGRLDVALTYLHEALTMQTELGDFDGIGSSQTGIGCLMETLGRSVEAMTWYARARQVFGAVGNTSGQGLALTCLAVSSRSAGRIREALDHHRQSLDLVRGADPELEAKAYNRYGDTLAHLGEYGEAVAAHRAALGLVEAAGDRYEHARALQGLGVVAAAADDVSRARALWASAQIMFAELEVPEADEVAKILAAIGFSYGDD